MFAFFAAVGLLGGFQPASAQDATTTPRPERVGADAPHQERNPTQRPQAYLIRPAPAPTTVVDTSTVKIKLGDKPTTNAVPKKKRRAGTTRLSPTPERMVPVRKAIPMGPTPEEVAAEREAYRAELRRPMRVGSDAPHYERNGDPDASAARIITFERP